MTPSPYILVADTFETAARHLRALGQEQGLERLQAQLGIAAVVAPTPNPAELDHVVRAALVVHGAREGHVVDVARDVRLAAIGNQNAKMKRAMIV